MTRVDGFYFHPGMKDYVLPLRQADPAKTPWTPLRKPLSECAVTLVSAQGPNTYRHLAYEWPEPPEKTAWRAAEPPPLGKYALEKKVSLAETLVRAMRDNEREL